MMWLKFNTMVLKKYDIVVKIILCIYSLYALKYLFRLKGIESEFYMNITFIFIIASVYMLINYSINTLKKNIDTRLLVITSIFGLYIAIVAILGAYYEGTADNKIVTYSAILDFTFEQLKKSLIYIPALWFLSLSSLILLYNKLSKLLKEQKISENINNIPKIFNSIYKIWLFIFICWLPYFILLFPGYIVLDTAVLLGQLYSGHLISSHSILVTLYMYFILLFYKIFNNGVLSIGLYVIIFQMVPLSFVFAYMIIRLKKVFNINRNTYIFLILFFAFFPAHPFTSILIERGLLFIILFILFVLELISVVYNKSLLSNKKFIIKFILLGVLLALTRANVIYSLVFIIPLMLLFIKDYRKHILIISISLITLTNFTNYMLTNIAGAKTGNFREALSIPMQQLARVYKYHKDTLTDSEIKYIESMMYDKDKLNAYKPKLSDNVKSFFNANNFMTKDGIASYIKLGFKYPNTYLNTFLIMTDSLWYPFNNSFWYAGMHFVRVFDDQIKMMRNYEDVNNLNKDIFKYKNKALDNKLNRSQVFVKQNNSMSAFILLNQSIFFYIILFAFVYFIYKKDYENVIILLLPLGYIATIMLGPVVYLRYTYFLMAFCPIVLVMLTSRRAINV